jgi:sterol 3beta-glucosyltransferase
MVKNKGILPSGPSEISSQKKQLRAIMHSLLPACTKPDGPGAAPFLADTIIANPPAYGTQISSQSTCINFLLLFTVFLIAFLH